MATRKHIRVLFIAGIMIIACVAGWFVCAPRQPSYGGKSLSDWMDRYENQMSGGSSIRAKERLEADQAIREIGTNALPYLVRMVSRKDSALKLRFVSIYKKQKWIRLSIQDAQHYHAKATYGFGALREMASPAVPDLIRLLRDQDFQVRASSAANLSLIGPVAEEAIPALLPLLDERDHGTPILEAMSALGQIHRKPEIVLPRLAVFLNGDRKDWNYTTPALDAIGRFRTDARELAPLIATFLDDPDTSKQSAADSALLKVDPEFAREIFKARAGSR